MLEESIAILEFARHAITVMEDYFKVKRVAKLMAVSPIMRF